MKLNLTIILSLYCLLLATNTINSLNNDRLKSKSLAKSAAALKGEPGFMMTYEANLVIENQTKKTKEEIAVLIDKKNIEQNTYGFEVTLKDKSAKIISPIFFKLSDNVYYFSLKALTSQVDCLNDGLFSKNGMNFMLSLGGDSITVTFKYPNSWAFGDKNDIDWLCRKISENYNKYLKEDSDRRATVIEAITKTTDLEVEKSKNISNKAQLEEYIKFQKAELEKEKSKLDKLVLNSDILKEELRVLESSKSELVKKNSDNDIEIASREADLRNAENSIIEYSSKSTAVKTITDADVDASYLKVKSTLTVLMNAHSKDDPMYAKIGDLLRDVKKNKDVLLNSLK